VMGPLGRFAAGWPVSWRTPWWVGSVFEPDTWTSPVAWEVLAAEIGQFVTSVRNDVAAIGVEPSLIPGLVTATDAF